MKRLLTGLSVIVLGLASAAQAMVQPGFHDYPLSSPIPVSSYRSGHITGSSSVSLEFSCRNNPGGKVETHGLPLPSAV